MKKITLLLFLSIISIKIVVADLVLIPTASFEESKSFIEDPSVIVNLYRDEFVIATVEDEPGHDYIILDKEPWQENYSYYLAYISEDVDKNEYISLIDHQADVLHKGDFFIILRTDEKVHGQLPPPQGGMAKIFEREVRLPEPFKFESKRIIEPDPAIFDLFEEVNGEFITDRVQHLEDYGTRDAYAPESVLAQEWIEDQFLDMGLEVEVMDFWMPEGDASDNVIATLPGKKYPDEFVVLGGHYDSICTWPWGCDEAPGADDNASGTSGVMEIARILSQYQFERSIIFCAFSGEEYGLYGSEAYASEKASEGKNILGDFNMDMIGYLEPGHTNIMTSLIYPESAEELADFYTEVCEVYLPDFDVVPADLIGGDSDHTSFNNNGYMGIFPFEDVDNYSPYIHTPDDIVGLSYNHEEQAVIFTQAVLASVVTMANFYIVPEGLVAIPGDEKVDLKWNEMDDIDNFKIYRDGSLIETTTDTAFTDKNVENQTRYQYYITAISSDSGEETPSSEKVYARPMPPVDFPLFIDFENGTDYWELDEKWGITSKAYYSPDHSLSESPEGDYQKNRQDYAVLYPLDLEDYTDAKLSFWTKYDIEDDADFMYLEISENGVDWTVVDEYTGNQSEWVQKTYELTEYVNQPQVLIRFHFYSDHNNTKEGMYIDDFKVTVEGGYEDHYIDIPAGWSGISSNLIPAEPKIEDLLNDIADDLVILYDMSGKYWPEENINTIENWDSYSGYTIKTEDDVTLIIEGNYLEDRNLEISEGWNLIPVLSNSTVNYNELFEGVEEKIVIVKEVAGREVYWPSEDINKLDELVPGRAYMLKSNDNFTLTFPDSRAGKINTEPVPLRNKPWQLTNPTPGSHVISVPFDVLKDFETGDFIGVFTEDNQCGGYLKIKDNSIDQALVAFPNDTLTDQTDGFINDEEFNFKLYKNSTGEEIELIAGFDNSYLNYDSFSYNGFSKLTSLEPKDYTGITEHDAYSAVYPNPARNKLNITVKNDLNTEVVIVNTEGRKFVNTSFEGMKTIDVSGFPGGVYFIQIKGNNFLEVHKVIIN